MNWTKITHDSNGNPRYVCHFFALLTPQEISGGRNLYDAALIRARKIGGRKFHNKQFGGGIVFSTYSIPELEEAIKKELAK
jgi:hypothetical protein